MFWLVLFSIVVHGISVPILDVIYRQMGVPTIQDEHSDTLPFARTPSLPRYSESPGSKETVVMIEGRLSKSFQWGGVATPMGSTFGDDKKSFDVSDVRTEIKEWI